MRVTTWGFLDAVVVVSSGAQEMSVPVPKCSGVGIVLYILKTKPPQIQCTSIVTAQPSTSAQTHQCYFVGRGDFPQSETDYLSRAKQSSQKRNWFDIQSAKMSRSIYSQSSVFPKYQIFVSIKGASNQSTVPSTPIKDRHLRITLPKWFYSWLINISQQTYCLLFSVYAPPRIRVYSGDASARVQELGDQYETLLQLYRSPAAKKGRTINFCILPFCL